MAVCLAACNGTRWLDEQLDSILGQVGVSVKVFVSVDQSTDGTEALVEKRVAADDRVVALPYGERFGGAALNFFRLIRDVDISQFDYVSFADQDDIWLPDKLLRAHQELLRTGADAYSSNVIAFWSSGAKSLIVKSQPQTTWDFLFEAAGPGCTYVMRRPLAAALQELLEKQWTEARAVRLHDWLFYAYARAKGYRWHIDERAGMLYRQHEGNQVGVNVDLRGMTRRARHVLDQWGLAQAALIARLCGLAEDPFVKRWSGGSRAGLLWLALHARACRRRPRDRALFAGACLVLCVTGRRG